MELIKLEPVFSHTVWGGSLLRQLFNYQEEGDDIGECWGIAAHRSGDCSVSTGKYKGEKLSSLWTNHPELFGRKKDDEPFPLLVKIIHAKDDLSIQVHPDDKYAKKYENGSLGKTECWYILDAKEGAKLVVGHNAKSKQELDEMIDNGDWDKLIKHIAVKPGDFIQINPGAVHAITGGVVLLETQQSSDITYRLYDYDRKWNGKKRDLHLDKCKDVITVPDEEDKRLIRDDSSKDINKLYSCKYYTVYRLNCEDELSFNYGASFLLGSVVDGEGTLILDNKEYEVKKGDHFIVPNGNDEISLKGKLKLICSHI